jgi:hypothetical protein
LGRMFLHLTTQAIIALRAVAAGRIIIAVLGICGVALVVIQLVILVLLDPPSQPIGDTDRLDVVVVRG